MNANNATKSARFWNICSVLAGAYRGGRDGRSEGRKGVTHLEAPDGNDAACGGVKEGMLCDVYGSENVDGDSSNDKTGNVPTCKKCARILEKAIKAEG